MDSFDLDDFDRPGESELAETTPNLRRIDDYDWLPELEAKIWKKHKLLPEHVEECFSDPDPKGRVLDAGDDKYLLLCHSLSGRYLFIVFAYKRVEDWLLARIISARPMSKKDLRTYKGK